MPALGLFSGSDDDMGDFKAPPPGPPMEDRVALSIAAGFARNEIIAEDAEAEFDARMRQLLLDPAERDPGIWDAAGVKDIGLTYDAWTSVPVEKHNEIWQATGARIIAAAIEQAKIEIVMRPMLIASEKSAKITDGTAAKMTSAEARSLSEKGVSKEIVNGEKERERNGDKK